MGPTGECLATTPPLTIWFGSHPLMFAPLADFQERGDTTCPPGTGISQGGGPPPKEMVTQLGVATQPLDSQHPHNKPTPVLDLSRTVNEDIINWLMSPNAPGTLGILMSASWMSLPLSLLAARMPFAMAHIDE